MKKYIKKYLGFLLLVLFISTTSCSLLLNRKSSDSIKNDQAFDYYVAAQNESRKGREGFQNAMDLFNKADELEPQNPFILSERGMLQFNAKLSVENAFKDLDNSIKYATDKNIREMIYGNRALCFMSISDIKSACSDWENAGKMGARYIAKYCVNLPDTIIQYYPPKDLDIKLELIDTISTITSTHNSPSMSSCMATISMTNNTEKDIRIKNSLIDDGLEQDSTTMYLEAVNHLGEKFIFFTSSTYAQYSDKDDEVLKVGESFNTKKDLTFVHQFPYPGFYEIRVAIRPSENLIGLDKTYYSNWVTLQILDKK